MMSWLVARDARTADAAGDTASIRSVTSGAAGIAGPPRPGDDRRHVEPAVAADEGYLLSGHARHKAGVCTGTGERRLHVEHRLQPRDVADGRVDRFAAEEQVDEPVSGRRRRSHVRPAG